MFVEIANTPRDYAWGSRTAIAELLGTEPSGGPEAELWLGAHPGSPARVVGEHRTLLEVVEGRLPFLLKVLAAAAPLSLQAHPTPQQAQAGFAREDAAGVPLDAPERNYRDAFHKPEIIYALSDPFRALSGFRPVADTREVLAPVAADPRIAPLLDRLVDDAALEPVFAWLIGRGDGVEDLVEAVVEAAATVDGPSWQTVRLLADHYPGDPGIVISLLLHTVELRPGEALFLPAGNIHAYLDGLGIELMAASDNVLRGGLTPKHVDVPELLHVLDFRPRPVPYLVPHEPEPGVRIFRPGVPDFRLTVIDREATARGVELRLPGAAIALCTAGSVALEGGPTLERGHAVYIDDETWLGVRGDGVVFVASGDDD
ncbi:mannose-6-phosphate isomerase, class I [Protaetiibacter mangrovi]|uniref:mannose-6-phosphate isomerase n=1 Tax=Protaetiibacter mangrovi TaxID=2970926 RepID=A0ABT1ZFG9_9MICO|nr:mannose-6-phosphate isomerase, class I [Protaetiibacter mangrovi]MCS0499457.1 mannose-6-phosphate isomerase, class I [Protaetiibacter mangrovi]TPX04229.1 mannose-6-phosphate isomerase, class I [Schumannella luteola]